MLQVCGICHIGLPNPGHYQASQDISVPYPQPEFVHIKMNGCRISNWKVQETWGGATTGCASANDYLPIISNSCHSNSEEKVPSNVYSSVLHMYMVQLGLFFFGCSLYHQFLMLQTQLKEHIRNRCSTWLQRSAILEMHDYWTAKNQNWNQLQSKGEEAETVPNPVTTSQYLDWFKTKLTQKNLFRSSMHED